MKTNLYQPLLVILALIGMIEISSCAVEQEASIPRDGTVLSGSYALDNGTGLTNTYLTFTNGKIYEYTCSSTVVFAEGYLWNVSSRDFSLRYSGECSISDGTLYRDGIPCGRLKISENTLVLNEVIYRKYNGFKSGRYSVIKIEGSSLRTINYQEQEIEIQVSVSKTIPSGVLRAQVDADWLYLRSNDNGKFSFFAREFDAASTNSSRSGKITFYYPGTENRQMTIQQNRQNTSLNITSSTQNINETGGTYSIDYSINDPINGVFLLASSQSDWISDIAVNNNQINYSVSPLLGSIPSRVGVIECKYGEKIVVDICFSRVEMGN